MNRNQMKDKSVKKQLMALAFLTGLFAILVLLPTQVQYLIPIVNNTLIYLQLVPILLAAIILMGLFRQIKETPKRVLIALGLVLVVGGGLWLNILIQLFGIRKAKSFTYKNETYYSIQNNLFPNSYQGYKKNGPLTMRNLTRQERNDLERDLSNLKLPPIQ